MNHKEKIEQLLAAQNAVNNALAFELLKSQLGFDTRSAMKYILKYQIENFWKLETKESLFKINETQFKSFIFEEEDAYVMDNRVDLHCQIINGEKMVERKEYLGDFGYNIVVTKPDEHSPTLFNYKEAVLQLFSSVLDDWLNENQI